MSTKKALLIGINYRGTNAALRGCINDVHNVRDYLLKNGYKDNDITIMTDDTVIKPKRKNMITAILELIMSKADQLYLHYSGHGSWQKDLNGDEKDGRDETLVPLDYRTSGMLTDDQLRGLLTFMDPRSKFTIVLDCCHSGTGMDLAYSLCTARRMIRIKRGRRYIRKRKLVTFMKKDRRYFKTPGQVVMVSGCLDKQTSADGYEENKYQGALTYCLLKVLEENKSADWGDLIDDVRGTLKSLKYNQIATLTSGRRLSLNSKVDFC